MSESPEVFKNHTRRCLCVFAAIIVGTLLMVAASFAPLGSRSLNIALVLTVASCNALLVATYLMHLISERRLVHVVLVFTAIFFVALMFLSIFAAHDLPHVGSH